MCELICERPSKRRRLDSLVETQNHFLKAVVWYDQEHIQNILSELHARKHKHGDEWTENICQDDVFNAEVIVEGMFDLFNIHNKDYYFRDCFLKIFKMDRLTIIFQVVHPIMTMESKVYTLWCEVLDSLHNIEW